MSVFKHGSPATQSRFISCLSVGILCAERRKKCGFLNYVKNIQECSVLCGMALRFCGFTQSLTIIDRDSILKQATPVSFHSLLNSLFATPSGRLSVLSHGCGRRAVAWRGGGQLIDRFSERGSWYNNRNGRKCTSYSDVYFRVLSAAVPIISMSSVTLPHHTHICLPSLFLTRENAVTASYI